MPLLSPKEQYEADVRAQQSKKRLFRRKFTELLTELAPLVTEVRSSLPEDTSARNVDRALIMQIRQAPAVLAFFEAHLSAPRQIDLQPKIIKALTEVLTGKKSKESVRPIIDAVAALSVQAVLLAQSQEPLSTIPPDIRAFLPPKIALEVDPSGALVRLTDRFANEERTLEVKIDQLKAIMRNIDQIRNQLNADLRAEDEGIRIAALVTLLILETGIRPGDVGTAAHVYELVEGVRQKVLVETFGATTLRPGHVILMPDGSVELRFVGKKGTLNIAVVHDPLTIEALLFYRDRAIANQSPDLLVMANGRKFTYRMLLNYFSMRFPEYDPTDFRKLRAAEIAYQTLRNAQAELYREIRSFVELTEDQLKSRIVDSVKAIVADAVEQARAGLSHKDKSETIESYLDPRMILQFLSRGEMAATLRDAILDDSLVIQFDPLHFSRIAASRSNPRARRNGADTLRELLTRLQLSMRSA